MDAESTGRYCAFIVDSMFDTTKGETIGIYTADKTKAIISTTAGPARAFRCSTLGRCRTRGETRGRTRPGGRGTFENYTVREFVPEAVTSSQAEKTQSPL